VFFKFGMNTAFSSGCQALHLCHDHYPLSTTDTSWHDHDNRDCHYALRPCMSTGYLQSFFWSFLYCTFGIQSAQIVIFVDRSMHASWTLPTIAVTISTIPVQKRRLLKQQHRTYATAAPTGPPRLLMAMSQPPRSCYGNKGSICGQSHAGILPP